MHTDKTAGILHELTKILGAVVRDFKATVCCKFNTRELTREVNARIRRQAGHASQKACMLSMSMTSQLFDPYVQESTPQHATLIGPLPTDQGYPHNQGAGHSRGRRYRERQSQPRPSIRSLAKQAINGFTPTTPGTTLTEDASIQTQDTSGLANFQSKSSRRTKELNLNTYTFHAMGDYASTILTYGTTDSYTSERVSSSRFCHGTPSYLI